ELTKMRGLAQWMRLGISGEIRVDEAFQIQRGNDEVLTRVTDRILLERGTDIRPDKENSPNMPLKSVVKEDAFTIVKSTDAETRRQRFWIGSVCWWVSPTKPMVCSSQTRRSVLTRCSPTSRRSFRTTISWDLLSKRPPSRIREAIGA